MSGKTHYLYSVWRNSDDKLMILDGTMRECLRAMGVTRSFFYRLLCEFDGRNGKWTVIKKTKQEVQAEIDE